MKTKPLPDLCQYDKAECPPKSKAKKDKRHWCRGKVGVKHQVKWGKVKNYTLDITTLLCIECGKHLAWFSGVWRKEGETNAEFKLRFAKAWEDKQANIKRRLAYYLDFVD